MSCVSLLDCCVCECLYAVSCIKTATWCVGGGKGGRGEVGEREARAIRKGKKRGGCL